MPKWQHCIAEMDGYTREKLLFCLDCLPKVFDQDGHIWPNEALTGPEPPPSPSGVALGCPAVGYAHALTTTWAFLGQLGPALWRQMRAPQS